MTAWVFAIAVCVAVHGHDYCSTLKDRYAAEDICDRHRAAMATLFKRTSMTFACVRERRRVSTRHRRQTEPLEDTRRL